MRDPEVEEDFPELLESGYDVTSPPVTRNNCIGWALGDKTQYWDPGMVGVRGFYWPPGIPREDSLRAWTRVFEMYGYRICESANLEPGVEKVAIYADAIGTPTHVAKQQPCGQWTSKLGRGVDIEHDDLAGLQGDLFGEVVRILKRGPHDGR